MAYKFRTQSPGKHASWWQGNLQGALGDKHTPRSHEPPVAGVGVSPLSVIKV